MSVEVVLGGKKVVGVMGLDGKMKYDNTVIREMIAGQSGKTSGKFSTTAQVIYRYDKSRKTNDNSMYTLWRSNVIMDNRISQLNALVFGRGIKWVYEEKTKGIIDRFWRVNRLRSKLNSICTDGQLYGEVFIGLYPQPSGDVLLSIYESRQVDIDFDPSDVSKVNKYIVTYRNDETNKDEQFELMPIEKYLNSIEMDNAINGGIINKVRKSLGLMGGTKVEGKGVMCHIKFNNSSAETNGVSDFFQVSDVLQDYMDFVGDRLTIHQMYGSPAFDITIDTDDEQVIIDRIDELAAFELGSNPVHNKQETWKPLEFQNGALSPSNDDKLLRGLICAGMKFPEYLLFNQSEQSGGDDNTFAVSRLAQDRQDTYCDAFIDIHKFVVAIAGGDIATIDDGQIIFPEIDTMSEKAKAETYVLKVGANIVSRRTAATNMGHNYDIELEQMQAEAEILSQLSDDSDFAGALTGRFNSRKDNTASQNADDADHGDRDRQRRSDATRVDTTQVVNSDRKHD